MSVETIDSAFFRRKRMRRFARLFAISSDTRVIDIGGSAFNWTLLDVRPHVLVVNNDADTATRGAPTEGKIVKQRGDGRRLAFADASFDVAFSNSVIEHVGGWDDQRAFAAEVARVAKHYFVQVPNRNFFIEPHFVAPFLQFLPRRLAVLYARYLTPWGIYWHPTRTACENAVDGVKLLTFRQMRQLFPDAELVRERFLGMTKSIIAVRQ